MPNWVVTRMIVTGSEEELTRFREDVIIKDKSGQPTLDFNRVIPRPEAFEGSAPTNLEEMAWVAWYGPDEPDFETDFLDLILRKNLGSALATFSKDKGIETRKDLQRYLLQHDPNIKKTAAKLNRNLKNYGAFSFYDWSVRNWGTKWNASEFELVRQEEGRMEFVFSTAWSPPEPIFWELSKLYPELTWDIKSFEDNFSFGLRGLLHDGEGSFEEVEATSELYEEVYGHPYKDEPEDGP